MKIKNIGRFIVFLSFFIYLFVVYDVNFNGPDCPVYLAYTASVVDDGDLNAAKHSGSSYYRFRPLADKIPLSKTYNLPDYHNHAGVVLWVPFYVYAKLAGSVADRLNIKRLTASLLDRLARCALSFSTITFTFFTVLLTYMLSRIFFPDKLALCSCLAIFFGTPFVYYALQETGNATIVACLLSIVSIWFCFYALGIKRRHWFLYGLFFSICVAVKSELWLQVFFIFPFFIYLLRRKQTSLINGVYFVIGIIPGLALKAINDYIKYAALHIGELNLFGFGKNFYFFKQLFSSYRGFFYTSPVFYICLLGAIFLIINSARNIKSRDEKKLQDHLFLILTSYLIIKIVILSYRYAWGGGSAGSRVLLTEYPIFVLLYARALSGKTRRFILFALTFSLLAVFWNFMVIGEYVDWADKTYIAAGAPALTMRIKVFERVLPGLFYIKNLPFKLRLCLPLFLAVIGLTFYALARCVKPLCPSFWHIKYPGSNKIFRNLALFTVYLCGMYTVITALNAYNNKRNVEELKTSGFFNNAVIADHRDFEKKEIIGSLDEMIEYFTLSGDYGRVNKIKRYKAQKYGAGR
jgi:hypothetical protein